MTEVPACPPAETTNADQSDAGQSVALNPQLARYAEDLAALADEVQLLRRKLAESSPEREIASRLQHAFGTMVRTLSSYGMVITDRTGRITHATGQAAKLFDLAGSSLIGCRLADVTDLGSSVATVTALQDLVEGEPGRIEKLPVRAMRGPHVQLLLHAMRADEVSPPTIFWLIRPASAVEVERPVQQMLLADVFAGTTNAWMVTNHQKRILAVNAGFTAITGYEAREVLGQTPRVISSGRHGPAFYSQMWQEIAANGEWQGEVCNRRRNGELYEEWLHISAYRDGAGKTCGYVALFYDLVFARKAYERIDQLVHTDALTRLPNRALFLDRLSQAVQRARAERQRFGVLTLDIDRFKEINDTLGHNAGDEVLAAVASRLRNVVGADMLLARLGGDEFVLLAEGEAGTGALEAMTEDLRMPATVPLPRVQRSLYVTVSAGMALFPSHGEDASTLLRNADIALDTAKRGGGNAVRVYQDEFSRGREERFSLSGALRQALEKQQMRLVYQAQVDAATLRVTGVEALLRWHLPGQGEIAPDRFVPLAEETGLIVPIGTWVLEQACAQHVAWRRQGLHPLRVAVNITGRQLREPRTAELIISIIAATGIDPHYLEIEVTESELMGDVEEVVEVLTRLRALGITIAVDDFGTGYSSLGRLHALPIDRLKVDRSFVLAMGTEKGAAIPRAILALAASLGLATVAEGVETEDQAAQLRAWGCTELQGYLFSRPVPPDQIVALLA